MYTCFRSPARRFCALASLFLTAATFAGAQSPVEPLDPFVTTGTRTPVAPGALGLTVDTLSAADLQRQQVSSLSNALGGVAGAPLFASGAAGGSASLFLRGANSNQTLFLVDGIRLNDPNTDYQLFLGGACLGACDSLEISHGPQSTLYGGEAMGGVISLRAEPGRGEPTTRIAVEGGSFETVQASLSTQGQRDAWRYSLSASGGHTANDRPHNAFDSGNVTGRLDRVISETLTLGATLRGFVGEYQSPGDRFTNDSDNIEEEDNWLGTLFADWSPTAELRVRSTLGGQDRQFVSTNPSVGNPPQITTVKNRRGVWDTQATWTGLAEHRLTGGFTYEANSTRNDGFGDIDERQQLAAVFLQDEWSPTETLFLTAGIRSDDHDTFGRATTGRVTAAWLIVPDRVKVRASFGTAFRSPSFLDLYGDSPYYMGNPDLQPEKARGGDVGVDLYLPDHQGSLSLTWFDTHYRNLIVFDFGVFPGTTANVDEAQTRGLELTAKWTPSEDTSVRVAYTYLEAENQSAGIRLLRRPTHALSADAWHRWGAFSAGLGLRVVADREDVAADTFLTISGEDYSVARIYTAYEIREGLTLQARIENALDETYEEVHGYPQPGAGAYAGVVWQF